MLLSQLKVGEGCTIDNIGGRADTRLRLMQLGFTKGTSLVLYGRAPMGDPIEVLIRGSRFSIRKSEAECIEVTKGVCGVGCEVCACGKSKLR